MVDREEAPTSSFCKKREKRLCVWGLHRFHLWSVPNLRKPLHTSQIFRPKPTWFWWVKVQTCCRITPRCYYGHRTSDGVHRVDTISDSSRSKMQQICFHWCSSADREQPQPVLTGVQGKVSVQVGNIKGWATRFCWFLRLHYWRDPRPTGVS